MSDASSLKSDSSQHIFKILIQQTPKGLLTIGKKKAIKLLCLSDTNVHIYDFVKSDLETLLPIDSIIDWKISSSNVQNGQKCDITINYTVKSTGKAAASKKNFIFTCWQAPELLTLLSSRMAWIRGLNQSDSSFFVRKWKKSNEYVEYTLKFYGARIYKFDNTTNQPLGFINMKDIKNVCFVKEKPDVVVLFTSEFNLHYYSTNNVKAMLQSIQNHLNLQLNYTQLKIEEKTFQEIVELKDFQRILNDQKASIFQCEHKVERLKNSSGKIRNRRLKLNSKFIVEYNDQNQISSIHKISDIDSIIRSSSNNENFSIKYISGDLYTYSSNKRDTLILNILEMKRKRPSIENQSPEVKNNLTLSEILHYIQLDLIQSGQREGVEGSTPHPTYSEQLLKRIIEKHNNLEIVIPLLREFNQSFKFGEIPCKDKKLLSILLTVLKSCLEEKNQQLLQENALIVLFSISKCLSCKILFDEIFSLKANIQELLFNTYFKEVNNSGVRFITSSILIQMISHEFSQTLAEKHMAFFLSRDNIDLFLSNINSFSKDPNNSLFIHNILFVFSLLIQAATPQIRDSSNYLLARLFEPQSTLNLFSLCRHDSLPISLLSSALLSQMLFISTGLQYEQLQRDILTSGLLITQIYFSLYSKDDDIRETGKRFVDLCVSYNEDAELLMTKIVPKPLLPKKTPQIVDKELTKQKQAKSKTSTKTGVQSSDNKYRGWYQALNGMNNDISNAACMWSDHTRQDLEDSLLNQIRALDEAEKFYADTNERYIWNYKEYETDFKSLATYEKVGDYYLAYLDSSDQTKRIEIEDPESLVKELYYKMILTDDDNLRTQYIRALSRTYLTYLSTKNVPFPHLDNLVKILSSEIYSQDVIMELIGLVHAIMTVEVNRNLVNQYCVPMLVHFVRKIHSETSHDLKVAKICLSVLKHLSTFRVKTVDSSIIFWPLPIAVREMSDEKSLPHLIQCILSAPSILKRTTLQLIIHLVNINRNIISSLYKSGIYYFIFASLDSSKNAEESKNNEENSTKSKIDDFYISLDAVQLLQATINYQSFNLNSEENILCSMLPHSIITNLSILSSEKFKSLFNSNTNDESVIWNSSMRLHLVKCVSDHIKSFITELRAKDGDLLYQFSPISKITYQELVNQPFASGYYLKNITIDFLKDRLSSSEKIKLFWSIAFEFKNIIDLDQLYYFLITQRDILKIQEGIFTDNIYSSFEKIISILSFKIDDTNLELLSTASEVLHLVTSELKNVRASVEFSIPNLLCDLIPRLLSYRDSLNLIDTKAKKSALICNEIISRSFILLTQVASSPFIKDIMDTKPDLPSLVMKSIYSIEYPNILRPICDFIIALCKTENVSFLKKLWDLGFLHLSLNIMLYKPETEVNEQTKNFFVKASMITFPLSILIASSFKFFEENNFIFQNVNSILPIEIVIRLKILGLNQKNAKDVMDLLHGEWKQPGIIWTKDMKRILHNYVSSSVNSMVADNFTKYIKVVPIVYEELNNYLFVGSIFLDIYVEDKWDDWQPRDIKYFASELLEFLSNPKPEITNHLQLVISSCSLLLERTKQQNSTAFDELISEIFSEDINISIIFNLLLLNKNLLYESSLTKIISILSNCFNNSEFLKKISSSSISCLHNFIYALDYAVDFNPTLIKTILEFLKTNCLTQPLHKEIETNGILLYLLLIISGAFENTTDEDRKESIRIISIFLKNNLKENERYEGNCYDVLKSILPPPIIEKLCSYESSETLSYFESKLSEPNIVWNNNTRKSLREYLEKQKDYMKSNKKWIISKSFKLDYKLENDLIIEDIHVRLFNDSPSFKLPNPDEFLRGVCESLLLTKDPATIQDLLLAMRNVLENTKSSDESLATRDYLNSISSKLLTLVGDRSSSLNISSLCLQLIYDIISNGNKNFLNTSHEVLPSFIRIFSILTDLQELFLVVLLAIAQLNDLFVEMIILNEIHIPCIEIMEERKGSPIALRAAQLIKYLVSSAHHQVVDDYLINEHSEIWDSYREIQLPPSNMPLDESLRIMSSTVSPRKL